MVMKLFTARYFGVSVTVLPRTTSAGVVYHHVAYNDNDLAPKNFDVIGTHHEAMFPITGDRLATSHALQVLVLNHSQFAAATLAPETDHHFDCIPVKFIIEVGYLQFKVISNYRSAG